MIAKPMEVVKIYQMRMLLWEAAACSRSI